MPTKQAQAKGNGGKDAAEDTDKLLEMGRQVAANRERQGLRRQAAQRALQEKIAAEGWDQDDVLEYGRGWEGNDDDADADGGGAS